MGATANGTSGIPFLTWTIAQAKKAAAIAGDILAAINENRAFIEGDHWQNGEGWIGPWPLPTEASSPEDAESLTLLQHEIERTFTSRNALGEVTERHVAGVVGREPRWTFIPRDASEGDELSAEQERARREIEDAVTVWFDESGAHAVLQELTRKLLYSESAGASLRIFIPAGLLTAGPGGKRTLQVKGGDLADALSKISVECPEPEDGRVVTDEKSGLDVGVLLVKDENSRETVELTFVDEGGKTVLLVIKPQDKTGAVGNADRQMTSFDLGGRLLMMQIERVEFLTEQARQSQRALNYANTMIVRNVTTGGFLEEILLNAKLPGHWEEIDGVRRYVADPILRGPGTQQSYSGHEYEDSQGNRQITTPSVVFREPVKPDASISAKQEHYADILDEVDQRHVLITGDAVASGVSRQQARADFRSSLQISEAPVNRAGRWMLETVLAYAEALSGSAGRFSNAWRVSYACILDTGPLSPEEVTAIQGSAAARLISRGTARELIGIADPDAEQQRIDDEDGVDLDEELKRAQLFKAWVDAGLDFEVAGELAGLTDEQVAAITPPEPEPEPAPAPGNNPAPGPPPPRPAPAPAPAG